MNTYITSESVTEGHPDKICDQISDAILDACLEKDPESRVACECLIKDYNLIIAGEISSDADVDYGSIALGVLEKIGYSKDDIEKYSKNLQILISEQSSDIALGVDENETAQGAGDQGIMYGYACKETPELMPLPLMIAHRLCKKLASLRKQYSETCPFLPDGKAQVTIEYDSKGQPIAIDSIVVSTQHKEDITQEDLETYVIDNVILPVCNYFGENLLREKIAVNPHFDKSTKELSGNVEYTKFYINPTGKFVIGGAMGDCGLTGRKIVVDTYGGVGRVGGGCFSGKDPSKVDRSGAYMARFLAKYLVESGYGDDITVQLAYAIGVAEPVDVSIHGKFDEGSTPEMAYTTIKSNFDLTPAGIIKKFNLKRPIYKNTATLGHFGNEEYPWEQVSVQEPLEQEREGKIIDDMSEGGEIKDEIYE